MSTYAEIKMESNGHLEWKSTLREDFVRARIEEDFVFLRHLAPWYVGIVVVIGLVMKLWLARHGGTPANYWLIYAVVALGIIIAPFLLELIFGAAMVIYGRSRAPLVRISRDGISVSGANPIPLGAVHDVEVVKNPRRTMLLVTTSDQGVVTVGVPNMVDVEKIGSLIGSVAPVRFTTRKVRWRRGKLAA